MNELLDVRKEGQGFLDVRELNAAQSRRRRRAAARRVLALLGLAVGCVLAGMGLGVVAACGSLLHLVGLLGAGFWFGWSLHTLLKPIA
jgi:hypothetical protein